MWDTEFNRTMRGLLLLACFLLSSTGVQAQYGWHKVHPRTGETPLTETGLHNVHFVDQRHGFIVGDHGTVLRTSDGGSWEKLDISIVPDPAPSLWAVTSDAAGNVYIGGGGVPDGTGGVLWRSTDLGDSWTDISMEAGFDIVELYFTDATTVFAVGDSGHVGWTIDRRAVIRKSEDAGQTWRTVANVDSRTAPGLGVCMRDIQFVSRDTGFAVGEHGVLLRSVDGGESWEHLDSWYHADYYGLHFFPDGKGLLYGESSSMPHTTDGGVTWDTLGHNWGYILDTYFVRPELGFACNKGIERTTDRGKSWTWDVLETVNPDFPAQTPQFQAMTFADAQHGWAVGHNGVIYGTSSGGLVHADAPPAPTTMSMTVLPSPLRQQQQGDLRLELPNTQSVRITLYNVLGQRIRIVYDGTLSAGTNHLSLDTADLQTGLYFLMLQGSTLQLISPLVIH
jgi:photosystem II stability/assembly factor-like uncharacterized protein